MKIFEVTQIQEAAPGSFAAKAGVFGKALAGALTQKAFGVDPSQYQDQARVDPNKINPAVKATVDKVSQQMIQTWPQTVIEIMKQSPGLRGSRGVTSFSKISQPLLVGELTRQIDSLVKSLTGGRQNSMSELTSISPTDAPIASQQAIKEKQRILSGSFQLLTKTDPSAKPDLAAKAWTGIINSIMTMAQTQVGSGDPEESKLRQAKITKDPSGKIAVNGRVLTNSPEDQVTLTKINSLGLMP